MSLTSILDFTSVPVLVVWIILFLVANICGLVKKNSYFSLVTLVASLAFLIIHLDLSSVYGDSNFANMIFDFISMAVSISVYLYIDDIESRREVISEVFENKYKK